MSKEGIGKLIAPSAPPSWMRHCLIYWSDGACGAGSAIVCKCRICGVGDADLRRSVIHRRTH